MDEFLSFLAIEFELPLSNPVLVFSLILFIILLAPLIIRKLNIPGIIGLIVSGIIVGPYGFNFLEKNSAVDLFSTIGLLYIMFIAGLDLDMTEFKKNIKKSMLFGFFTFAFPLAIGFPVCHYLLGYSVNASILIASMFSTHTLVSYPIVSKLGISKNKAVAITVGGTIITDTAVLIILAIIIGSHSGNLSQDFWVRLIISMILFAAIMFYLIPKITKWFFKKLESEKHAHYIFVLSVVFLSAFLAEISGVEPIIGAFVAGLALNPIIPQSSPLMNRIEFIGNSLFIPFFLISVGMLVDISIILKGPQAIIIATVLTIVALSGKWLAAFFTQIIFKFSKSQRQLIFGLSSSHAAATLAVILVGFKAGIIGDKILNGTIILILVTCVVASFATEKAGKKIVLLEKSDSQKSTDENQTEDEHILVPIANLSNIEKLMEFTFFIKDNNSPNPITLLSVVANNSQAEENIILARKRLEAFKNQGAASEINVNTIATIDYNPISGISRISRELMADIIILGWPQRAGIIDKFFGEQIFSITNKTNKNIFLCDLKNSLLNLKQLIIVTPPLAENEIGFDIWVKKITLLSFEISVPMIHYGTLQTKNAIAAKLKKIKHHSIDYKLFDDIDNFSELSTEITSNDLLVFVSARNKGVSYQNSLSNIPDKLEKQFTNQSKIVIFPQHYNSNTEKNQL